MIQIFLRLEKFMEKLTNTPTPRTAPSIIHGNFKEANFSLVKGKDFNDWWGGCLWSWGGFSWDVVVVPSLDGFHGDPSPWRMGKFRKKMDFFKVPR